jgi:hypothetical protein
MLKAKRLLIKYLLRLIERLDPLEGYEWPDKMNYDQAVDALLRQSPKGRATFNYRYIQALNSKDLNSVKRYVQARYQEKTNEDLTKAIAL